MMNLYKILIGFIAFLILVSCANRAAGPTGGPRDSIPPIVLRSLPENGAVNYRKKEILVYFNENVTLDKVSENFIISPPQQVQPVVKANGKVLSVVLEDELADSTTYSLFFGNAVVDLNEKNPLTNYQFAFSTGNEIDTLQVSGSLYDAYTLDPVPGIYVGLHTADKDSAIYNDKFIRITKTDEEGRFTIKNIKAGTYSIYALGDTNRDFAYQPGEDVAFLNATIIPEVKVKEHSDTTWADSITVDTIRFHREVSYHPDTLSLSLFKELKKRQYLVKSERKEARYFSLFFNTFQDSLPLLRPLNFDTEAKLILQRNSRLDSLTWWIADSAVYKQDTLTLEVTYLKSDSVFNLVSQTDTLNLTVRRPTATAKTKVVPVLNFTTNLGSSFDLNADIDFKFEQPLLKVDTSLISLVIEQDTLKVPVSGKWEKRDSIGIQFKLRHDWKAGGSYELTVDSAAFTSIYGVVNKSYKSGFTMKTPEDYSSLKLMVAPFDSLVVLQVIDQRENIVQQQKALKKGNLFEYLKPGDYFVKLFVDENQNGKWDTGDLAQRKFPERVAYFSKKLSLKANWELEESWDFRAEDDPLKKPDDLVKSTKKTP